MQITQLKHNLLRLAIQEGLKEFDKIPDDAIITDEERVNLIMRQFILLSRHDEKDGEFLDHIINLKCAVLNLNNFTENMSEVHSNIFCSDYPFENDFNEKSHDIVQWIDTMERILNVRNQ